MACKRCGRDWATPTGKDCSRCPHCDKLQLWIARQAGRWVEPKAAKQCICCGSTFDAVGPKQIAQRVLCGDPECAKAHRKAGKQRRAAGVFLQNRVHKRKTVERFCRRCGAGPLGRCQKQYCGKPCFFAAVNSGEQRFVGRVHDAWADLVDWAYQWDKQRPGPHGKSKTYKPRQLCEVCGKECNYRHSKFCSRECCKSWRGPRKCRCGKVVEQAKAYRRPSCCDCKRKAKAKYRRYLRQQIGTYRKKCRKYGGYYNSDCKRKAILEQDKYVCHVCGRKCRSGSDWNHPRSATVDHHPVPLSKGGDHDWHNVRCACRSCNSNKGDRWDGQRMLTMSRGM